MNNEKLDKDIFKAGIIKLTHAFPSWGIATDNAECMRFWYKKFSNYNKIEFEYAVERYCDAERFNPTIAGLKQVNEGVVDYYSRAY